MASIEWEMHNTNDGIWWSTDIDGLQLRVNEVEDKYYTNDGVIYTWTNNRIGCSRGFGIANTMVEAMSQAVRSTKS